MLQEILQKNKAATQYLLTISRTGPLGYGLCPTGTKSIEDTIQEIHTGLVEGNIPDEEKDVALGVIQAYQEIQKTLQYSLK